MFDSQTSILETSKPDIEKPKKKIKRIVVEQVECKNGSKLTKKDRMELQFLKQLSVKHQMVKNEEKYSRKLSAQDSNSINNISNKLSFQNMLFSDLNISSSLLNAFGFKKKVKKSTG